MVFRTKEVEWGWVMLALPEEKHSAQGGQLPGLKLQTGLLVALGPDLCSCDH